MPNGSGWHRRYDDIVKPVCTCVIKNREENESERDWFKRWMCMHHWVQTDYYREKLLNDDQKIVKDALMALYNWLMSDTPQFMILTKTLGKIIITKEHQR